MTDDTSSGVQSESPAFPLTSALLYQLDTDIHLLDGIGIGALSFTPSYRLLAVSRSAAKELNFTGEEKAGEELRQYLAVYHDNRIVFPLLLSSLVQGKASVELPANSYIRVERKNRKFYIKGQLIGLYEGERLMRVFFLFRNIEEELTREYILDLALSRTKIFPWFYDVDQGKLIIDARWFVHLGLPVGDCSLTAEEFAALLHPEDRDELIEALMQQIGGKLNKDSFTYRLRRGDGTWEWFEEQSAYLGEIDGAPYRIVGVCQSIQVHKNIEYSLIEARDKARESDRLKSAFLANVSHEIRTPLNAIVGFSNLLTSGEAAFDAEEAREYVHQIHTNSDQLLMLISDILDLSRIESNSMEFHYSPVSLKELLSDVYRAQALSVQPGVEFIRDFPQTDAVVRTDAMRLKQVVNNLINNAFKFTAQGKIVLGFRSSPSKEQVEIFVSDTGPGIAADNLPCIFERFYKADTFQKGTGLGLSICKSILNSLGGSVSVTSKPGEGSCFTVCLPAGNEDR